MQLLAKKPTCFGGLFLVVGALIAAIYGLFHPALPGIIHFDDLGNLGGLTRIDDFASAWRWVREGNAGPLGRPLALITFALQYSDWPQPAAFLQWNIAIHIINALLVFWLAVLTARQWGKAEAAATTIGFWTALTWALLPLLNTSVLFIVQRMALLAATFTLAGLIAYLKLRGNHGASWRQQFVALAALGGFGLLAVLAKESGALIVVYALVLELLVVARAGARRPGAAAVVLMVANAALLLGLVRYANWGHCLELQRGFDMPQRLGSQGVMLLVYLKGLFLPNGADLNPFRFESVLHDVHGASWGIVLWAALMLAPLWLWRRGWRLAALATAWFCYGHIMESGWIGLEPYFAHRNYLPAIGPVFLLVGCVFGRGLRAGWRGAAFVVYVALLATVTWMNTSLWGNRALAAEIWSKQEPRSVRAALNLAYMLQDTEGIAVAQNFLDRFMTTERDSTGLRLQSLVSVCSLNPHADHSQEVENAIHAINTLPYEGWATDLVQTLVDRARTGKCGGVSNAQIAAIASAFLAQPAYQCNGAAVHNLLSTMGLMAYEGGDANAALSFYRQALTHESSYGLSGVYLDMAVQSGRSDLLPEFAKLLAQSTIPRGTTTKEWEDLQARVQSAMKKP